jgi:N-acetylmuramoyl-L-alanine amidase
VFIRCLGLESLAPNPNGVTVFKDNDDIPQNAREAVFVAHRIGLIQGDEKGYLRPNEKITKGRLAALLNRFINYMRYDIRRDYRERIVNFN